MDIKISEIRITERIRKDNGDLNQLAASIKAHGLVNPITLMQSEDGPVLIAGFRRLSAFRLLGEEQIPAIILSPIDAEEQLRLEIEENESRKEFTPSERLEYGAKLRVIEEEKARKRKSQHARDGYAKKHDPIQDVDRGPHPELGKTRDVIAKQVGFKSGRQWDRASYIARNNPELMKEVDSGKKSITRAYEEAKGIDRKKPSSKVPVSEPLPPNMGIIHGMLGHIDSEYTRPDGFPFVLDEVETAARYYLTGIRKAATHYTSIMRNNENSKAISALLRDTFYEAAEAFGDNYIEEDNT